MAAVSGHHDRERPGADALRDAARDREGRGVDEGHLVGSAACDDVGDLVGRERAPRRAGTPLDRGVQLTVQEVDDGDRPVIQVGHEGVGSVPHHVRRVGAIAGGLERARRALPGVHRPQPVRELGRDPGLSAHRPGCEQRRPRPHAPHGAGDDPALFVEQDERRIPELAHEPAAFDADEVERRVPGLPARDDGGLGEVHDRDPAFAAQGHPGRIPVRIEPDAVRGRPHVDRGADPEGSVGVAGLRRGLAAGGRPEPQRGRCLPQRKDRGPGTGVHDPGAATVRTGRLHAADQPPACISAATSSAARQIRSVFPPHSCRISSSE